MNELNEMLTQVFAKEEVQDLLFQMNLNKAPGPDGFPVSFFHSYYSFIGDSMADACLSFLNEGGYLHKINHGHVVLIPKVKIPRRVGDFRPISLCNVIYKIIAKVLANWLKPILQEIISPNQCAFVPSRLITDNIIIGYECLHKIRNQRRAK